MDDIKKIYKDIKQDIIRQIHNFKKIWEQGKDEEIFTELAFCILTPQSKARSGWQAICNLKKKDLLLNGNYNEINKELNIVRFKNKKAEYLIQAREKFLFNGNMNLKDNLKNNKDIYSKRDWLVKEVKDMGIRKPVIFFEISVWAIR